MVIRIGDLGSLLKIAFKEWVNKDPFRQSAVIAYYAIFSIPGLLILVITITGYFLGKDAANQNIMNRVTRTLGVETADQIKEILVNSGQSESNIWRSIIGIGILLIGATGVFVELQKTLNHIWQVKAVPQRAFFLFVKTRLFSFGLIFLMAFVLLISFLISTILAAMGNWIKIETSFLMQSVFHMINFVFSLIVESILFASMFKFLPDAKIKWRHVWLGSLITALLFTAGNITLSFYFGKAEPASVYGAAGSVILILLWVSYSSMMIFFGAEFTAAYANWYTGEVPPSKIAKTDVSAKTD